MAALAISTYERTGGGWSWAGTRHRPYVTMVGIAGVNTRRSNNQVAPEADAAVRSGAGAGARGRLGALDALRGLIMVVMALDHANLFIAYGHPRPEIWSGVMPTYADPVTFLTRAVTHLAAPGFFGLMGAGMVLFAASRGAAGWKHTRVVTQLVVRGALLIGLQFLVEDPAWIWGGGGPLAWFVRPVYVGVLFALGGAMMVGALCLTLDTRILLALAGALVLLPELVIRYFATEALAARPLSQLLILPGATADLDVLYPVLPWLGVTLGGMVLGRWFLENPQRAYCRALYVGVGMLALFVPLRALGGFGNMRAPGSSDWIGFLNNVKYPPSLTFLLVALGLDLTVLFALSRRAAGLLLRPLSPPVVFGMTPLFFYLVHLYLYGAIGRTLFPQGTSIPGMYPWWLLGLVILYPLCLGYGRFKRARGPDSLWRMF